ncbi:MAG: T9SS type A sorting domain-containing protein [Bacteroidota bacterium]
MKRFIIVVTLVILCLGFEWTAALATDKFAVATGNWSATTTWSLTRGGASGAAVPAQGDSVIIPNGFTVRIDASGKVCKSLTIESGGTVYANTALPTSGIVYFRVYNGTVTTDGTLGTIAGDAVSFECSGTVRFAGSGTIRPARIRPRTDSTNVNIIIDCNMTMMYTGSTGGGGMALYTANSAANDNITVTVNTGRTLTLIDSAYIGTASSVTVDGTASTTFNINGTLAMQGPGSSMNLRVSTGKLFQLNIGSSGSVSVGRNLNASLGAGSTAITVASGGSLTVCAGGGGTADFTTPTVVVAGAGDFTLPAGGKINIGTVDGLDPATGPIQVSGTQTFSTAAGYGYVGTSAQVTGPSLPATIGKLTINNAAGVTLSSNQTVDSSTTMTAGALSLGGNILSYGTNYSVTYNGTSAQTTTSVELPATVKTLTISNAAGVALAAPLTVSSSLALTSGVLSLGANNLTLSGTVTGTPSATAMVATNGAGQFRKSFTADGSFTFPIGEVTGTAEYSPVAVTMAAGGYSSAYVSATVTNSKQSSNTSSTDFINRFWTLGGSGITSPNYSAVFTYKTADVNGTEANMYGGKYSGSAWTLLAAVDAGLHQFTAAAQTSFSDFTAGEQAALPVELSTLNVLTERLSATIVWSTATEVASSSFEIERRAVGTQEWTAVGSVRAAGSSNSTRSYSFSDANVAPGRYAYRLKAVNNDGSFKYYGAAEVEIGIAPNALTLTDAYPNPFNPTTVIEFTVPGTGIASLKVFNILGQEVATLFNGPAEAGRYYQAKFNGTSMPSGVYFARLESSGKSMLKKMLLTK